MDLCKDAELKKMLMRDKGGCMILNLIMQCGLKFQLAVQKRGSLTAIIQMSCIGKCAGARRLPVLIFSHWSID